jgi:8-oxo-dGTP pyrophosphatase MutT (NUDIX family)
MQDIRLAAPTDNFAYQFPVSVKGVVPQGDKVVLLKNDRDEWELPGGKLEPGETPEGCLRREIEEELGLTVDTGPILDSWVYRIAEGVEVFIVTFVCAAEQVAEVAHSSEHKAVGLFAPDEVADLNMPNGYKESIASWSTLRRGSYAPR